LTTEEVIDPTFAVVRHKKKRAFLVAFAELGVITYACRAAQIPRATYYVWMERDERFVMLRNQAEAIAIEKMEAEAHRRAVYGVDKPVFYQGARVATMKEYSDVLLIFLLKGAKPEKYKERLDVNQTQPVVKILEGIDWERV